MSLSACPADEVAASVDAGRGRWLERMMGGTVAREVEQALQQLKAAAEREAAARA